jgi:2-oxoglutarate ferredoxin oxidoreductase subunit alpha
LPKINPRLVKDDDNTYQPYKRDPKTLARSWALPGQSGLRHRIGGLEKEDVVGTVSQDPLNHEKMVRLREEKVQRVALEIPDLELYGPEEGELLVVGWGGTYGPLVSAVRDMQKENKSISLAQFNYIKPLPRNTGDVFNRFKKIIVCEMNMGQFAIYLRSAFPKHDYMQYNKIQGLPFMIAELKAKFNQILKGKQ